MEERRALYNSLRMSWLSDPNISVEPWQVEDYRSLRLDEIFEKLKEKDLFLDKVSFLALTDTVDTPEELTDDLLADADLDNVHNDQIYLLIFELWRRLVPEKPCLSIFCDELDHQIYLYDRGEPASAESIQDVLANLAVILDENSDEGADPVVVFDTVCAGCANNIETFLYDFIAEQLDNQNVSYATELLDDFSDYMKETSWFDFLKARALSYSDPIGSNEMIGQLIEEIDHEPDLEFNLEILSFMVQGGDQSLFVDLFKRTLPLVEFEEDLQDLMQICADYYHCLDHEDEELKIQKLLKSRKENPLNVAVNPKDSHIGELLKIVK